MDLDSIQFHWELSKVPNSKHECILLLEGYNQDNPGDIYGIMKDGIGYDFEPATYGYIHAIGIDNREYRIQVLEGDLPHVMFTVETEVKFAIESGTLRRLPEVKLRLNRLNED